MTIHKPVDNKRVRSKEKELEGQIVARALQWAKQHNDTDEIDLSLEQGEEVWTTPQFDEAMTELGRLEGELREVCDDLSALRKEDHR